MNPPERPDQQSIFSRPDPELDTQAPYDPAAWDRPQSAIEDIPASDKIVPAAPPSGSRPITKPPRDRRPVLIAAGLAGLAIMGFGGFAVASLLGGGNVALESPSPSQGPISAGTVDPSASPSPEDASPSPTPLEVAVPLAADQWATIVGDGVDVHADASMAASVVAGLNQGEVVLVLDVAPVAADGFSWYEVVAAPGVSGWIAAHSEHEQLALSDAPSASVPWCAIPDEAAFSMGQSGPQLGPVAIIGGLPISTDVLGISGSAVVELAWGTQDEVCLDLGISSGRTASVAINSTIEGCGHPYGGAPAMVVFGSGAVGSDGVADSRTAVVHGAILGYDPMTAGERPNLADVLNLGAYGQLGNESGEVCFAGTANGPAASPDIQLSGSITKCVWVSEVSASSVTLSHPENHWAAELRLTEGSFVGAGISHSDQPHAPRFIRVTADRGIDGSIGISPRDTNCQHSS